MPRPESNPEIKGGNTKNKERNTNNDNALVRDLVNVPSFIPENKIGANAIRARKYAKKKAKNNTPTV